MIPPVSLKWYHLRHSKWYRSYHSNDTAYDTLTIPLKIASISLKWYHPYHSNSTTCITQMIPMYFILLDCVISTCEHCRSLQELTLCQTVTFLWGKYVFFISDWEWDKFLSHKKKRLRIRNKQNVASCCDLHNHPKNSFGCKGTIFNRG